MKKIHITRKFLIINSWKPKKNWNKKSNFLIDFIFRQWRRTIHYERFVDNKYTFLRFLYSRLIDLDVAPSTIKFIHVSMWKRKIFSETNFLMSLNNSFVNFFSLFYHQQQKKLNILTFCHCFWCVLCKFIFTFISFVLSYYWILIYFILHGGFSFSFYFCFSFCVSSLHKK